MERCRSDFIPVVVPDSCRPLAGGSAISHVSVTRAYRPAIDGLRAIAVLFVVLEHAGVPWLSGGFTGVDIFFVISGYLIGGHVYGDLSSGRFSYVSFYHRRAKRILPALYIVLCALLMTGLILFDPTELRQLSMYSFATVASAANILCWQKLNYFAPWARLNPLLMTWSLGVEEQFYLLIPVALALIWKIRPRVIYSLIWAVTVCSFVLAWHQLSRSPNAAFYLIPARSWELSAGVALAIWETRVQYRLLDERSSVSNGLSLIGTLLIFLPVYFYSDATPFPGPFALPSVLGTAFVIIAKQSWINRKIFSTQALVLVGRVSYSWYLWHWPILSIASIILGRALPARVAFWAVVLSFLMALTSYQLVERPFRASLTAPVPALLRYAVASFILALVSFAIYELHGLNYRYPALAEVNMSRGLYVDNPCIVLDEQVPNLSPLCTAKPQSGNKIALWGDSHASALAPALRIRANENGYLLAQYEKTGCLPLIDVAISDPKAPMAYMKCVRFNDEVMKQIVSDQRVKIVALAAYWIHPFDQWPLVARGETVARPITGERAEQLRREALLKTIRLLQRANKQIVVFGDVPVFSVDPLWRMRTARIPSRMMLYKAIGGSEPVDPGVDLPANGMSSQSADPMSPQDFAGINLGVSYWPLSKNLCLNSTNCFYRDGDISYYVNNDHLAREGGLRALEGWKPSLRPEPGQP